MVISVTTRYERKIFKQKMPYAGSIVGVIREQIKKNFDAGGRPRKWAKNTRATLTWKKNQSPRLMLKPNSATGDMRRLAIKGRIKTVKRKGGISLKYIIPTSRSKNPVKFLEANRSRSILPFGNPNASMVMRPARPFIYISRQAYKKLVMMATKQIGDVVVSIAMPSEKSGYRKVDKAIQDTLNSWGSLNK